MNAVFSATNRGKTRWAPDAATPSVEESDDGRPQMFIKSIRTLAVAAAAALVLAACQAPAAVDKAGGAVTTLRLATIDEVNSNGQAYGPQAFVDSLAEVSGGMLKVEV